MNTYTGTYEIFVENFFRRKSQKVAQNPKIEYVIAKNTFSSANKGFGGFLSSFLGFGGVGGWIYGPQ